MNKGERSRRFPNSRSLGSSCLLLLGLAILWNGMLTLLFMGMFDNFIYRLFHPFESRWVKGPWGFIFIYGLLCIPIIPIYNKLDGWIESKRRRRFRERD